jgi:threonine dehydratase
VFSLTDSEAKRGVATHSSGNYGAALAFAAQLRDIPAHIVMPHNAPQVKRDAITGYGAHVVWCEPTQDDREATLKRVVDETGAVFVPPYNDARVIAGQGTTALELHADVPDLDRACHGSPLTSHPRRGRRTGCGR